MSSPETASRLARQEAIYGSPLSERFGRLMTVYGLSQRSLARVLGISAPMLSQLVNAQRIKIGNPAVYERLVMLEDRQDEPDLARVLAEVEASAPVLSTGFAREQDLLPALARLAGPEQLLATAQAARAAGAEQLAEALERAATRG